MNVFRNQILGLASPPDVQIGLFPRGVCIGDELVSDFDRHKQDFIANHELTTYQLNAIEELERFIQGLSGPHNQVFWCHPEPLTEDPRWEQIRDLAQTVLRRLNWEYALPVRNGATYVFSDRVELNADPGVTGFFIKNKPWWRFW